MGYISRTIPRGGRASLSLVPAGHASLRSAGLTMASVPSIDDTLGAVFIGTYISLV